MHKHQKPSTAQLRKKNRNNVYRLFYDTMQPKTKQDIALGLSMSLPTVTQNLKDLFDAGLIEYAGLIDSNGGRRARTMKIVPDAKIAVGMELSPKHIRLVAIDLYGNELAYKCVPCVFNTNEAYREFMTQSLENFLDDFSLDRNKLLGVGITLPAIINEKTNVIENAPILGIKQMEISVFTKSIAYPVYVVNDASAGGFAECWNEKNNSAMAYLFIGRGVGGAIILDGKPYNGQNLRSAEFGHICVKPNGRPCSCGQFGCLEAYCAINRLSDDLGIQTEEFFENVDKYADIFEEYLDHLCIAINTIRMIMDCDVVLGGVIAPFMTPYLGKIQEKLKRMDSFGSDGSYFRLGTGGAKANCVGAALHFVADFMQTI